MMVRDADDKDRDDVFRFTNLLSLTGPVDRAAFDIQFDRARNDPASTLLVTDDDGQLTGYLLAVIAPMFVYGGYMGFVQELYVSEDARRAGVGRTLMETFHTVATTAGATVVALATSRAGDFYEALEFTAGARYYTRRFESQRE